MAGAQFGMKKACEICKQHMIESHSSSVGCAFRRLGGKHCWEIVMTKEVYYIQVYNKEMPILGMSSSVSEGIYDTLDKAIEERNKFIKEHKEEIEEYKIITVSPVIKGWI